MNMTVSEVYRQAPTAFISYTHDSNEHRDWVRKLASDLRFQGIEVRIDQWDLKAGQDLYHFMEQGITQYKYVLAICTPTYKAKADSRQGGGGYETRIAAALVGNDLLSQRFIPILRRGDKTEAIPTYLISVLYLDFRSDDAYADALEQLVSTLFQEEQKPVSGWRKHELSIIFGGTAPSGEPSLREGQSAHSRNAPILVGTSIEALREESGVTEIEDIDNDRPVSEFVRPVFGFAVPWILRTDGRGVVGGTGPDRITLDKKPMGTSQLEVHLRKNGTVAFIAYANQQAVDTVLSTEGFSGSVVTLHLSPQGEYSVPISIPVGLIRQYRDRALPGSTLSVVDVRLA
jgi:hypothetical protein